MKALQCVELGGPEKLQFNEVPDPVIAPEHVIIELKAAEGLVEEHEYQLLNYLKEYNSSYLPVLN